MSTISFIAALVMLITYISVALIAFGMFFLSVFNYVKDEED